MLFNSKTFKINIGLLNVPFALGGLGYFSLVLPLRKLQGDPQASVLEGILESSLTYFVGPNEPRASLNSS